MHTLIEQLLVLLSLYFIAGLMWGYAIFSDFRDEIDMTIDVEEIARRVEEQNI